MTIFKKKKAVISITFLSPLRYWKERKIYLKQTKKKENLRMKISMHSETLSHILLPPQKRNKTKTKKGKAYYSAHSLGTALL
jgi:hypothetical protein